MKHSNHCLFNELISASTRVLLTQAAAGAHPLELKYQDVESVNLQGVSCRPRFECAMTFHIYAVIDTGTLDGIKVTVDRWLLA